MNAATTETRGRTTSAVLALQAVLALDADVLTPTEERALRGAIAALKDLGDGEGR